MEVGGTITQCGFVPNRSDSGAACTVSGAAGFVIGVGESASIITWAGTGGSGEVAQRACEFILMLEIILYQLSYFVDKFNLFCISRNIWSCKPLLSKKSLLGILSENC